MLGKYSTISNRRPANTHIYAMRTYFSPWQTSTANVTKPFLHKPVHPLRLNIGTLQNLPSCFHTSRFKSTTSIHCQHPLQKHVNNHIDNVNGVTFVTRKHVSPQGPIFWVYPWHQRRRLAHRRHLLLQALSWIQFSWKPVYRKKSLINVGIFSQLFFVDVS